MIGRSLQLALILRCNFSSTALISNSKFALISLEAVSVCSSNYRNMSSESSFGESPNIKLVLIYPEMLEAIDTEMASCFVTNFNLLSFMSFVTFVLLLDQKLLNNRI